MVLECGRAGCLNTRPALTTTQARGGPDHGYHLHNTAIRYSQRAFAWELSLMPKITRRTALTRGGQAVAVAADVVRSALADLERLAGRVA